LQSASTASSRAGTTPARTLLDLAAVLPEQAVRRAVNEAEVLRLADATALHDLKARHPGHRGISKLHEDHHVPALTRSELEAPLHHFHR
jgi:hypothetical protein